MTAIVPAWTGSLDDEVHVVGDGADHVQGDDRDADRPQLIRGHADVAAHDRAGQDEQPGARQVGDGAHGRGDGRLADERDGVDRDPFAAQVVAVGLAHRAEGDLGDLRPATDDDDPLAEDRSPGPASDGSIRTSSRPSRAADQGVLGDAFDLELDLDERRLALDGPDRRQRPDPSADGRGRPVMAESASARSTTSKRMAAASPRGGASRVCGG